MEWTAPKPTASPSSPPLLWDWGDHSAAGSGSSGDAPARRGGKEREGKRAKGEDGGGAEVRCQVEGCGLELGTAKEYHRKHRVCEAHTKCPRVVVAGQERRFCQQCSRFHALSEFDQKKRSCRRRLSDHNARRRKPQPDAFPFASARLPSSLFGIDDRRQISFVWNKAPLSHVRPFASPWDSSSDFKLPHAKQIRELSTKVGTITGQVHLDKSHMPSAIPTLCHGKNELLPMKGPDTSITASKFDGAPDLQRALSLLSAGSCGLPDPVSQASCLIQFTGASENSGDLHLTHEGNSGPASCADEQHIAPQPQLVRFTMDTSSNVYEPTFFGVNQIN